MTVHYSFIVECDFSAKIHIFLSIGMDLVCILEVFRLAVSVIPCILIKCVPYHYQRALS